MTKFLGLFICVLGLSGHIFAEQPEAFSVVLRASDPPAPVAEVTTAGGGVAMVTRPEMAVHLPDPAVATGLALVVCPGGSYREVGAFADGMRAVPYFVPEGVAVIVLKYRTRPPSQNVIDEALEDAKRAMRLIRFHAQEWGINPSRVGMLGSSAGSHLILNLATHADPGNPSASDPVDRLTCRPDFIALLCPWPNKQPVTDFPFDKNSPPAFVACAIDDPVAPITFSEDLVNAMHAAGVDAELWKLEKGGHRAFKQVKNPAYQWPERLVSWLKSTGFWTE